MFQKLSKNKATLIRQLSLPKYRKKHGLFVVEGRKMLEEAFAAPAHVQWVAATDEWLHANQSLLEGRAESFALTDKDLRSVSTLKTPDSGLAVIKQPLLEYDPQLFSQNFSLAIENVSDPGNLGTIVRTAHWFGVRHILCSSGTVDIFNPKAIQASMGSVFYVNLFYDTELFSTLRALQEKGVPLAVADMNGESVFHTDMPDKLVLIMGNETFGISEELKTLADRVLSVPRFPGDSLKPESLNVATAAGILMSAWHSQKIKQ